MEKAAKKVSDIEVELTNGTKKTLATLTKDDLPNMKLDGKKDEHGKFTSLTLKRGIVKDNENEYVERRLFKYADTDAVMYDLTIPLSEVEFNKVPFDRRLDLFVKALRIDADHDNMTGGGKPLDEKLLALASKKGATPAMMEDLKRALKKHGFGK